MRAPALTRTSTAGTVSDVLQLGEGLSLDADYVAGGSFALVGKRGAGKTFTARVLAEELSVAQVQTLVVDPMGVFWGLRASAGRTAEGLSIPVFGGQHGDAPLESASGALMADLAVDEHLSMILDLSGFGSRTQERTWAAAFFDRLYRRNQDLVHVIIDEADLFGPQRPRAQDAPLLATMENLVRRGRNNGIGVTMATQRAATLNKDLLTQVDGLVAMRVTAPQDRDAIRDWVRGQGDEDGWSMIAPSLPNLATGEAWWWIPEHKLLKRVQVRPSRTFDSSPTRTRGETSQPPKSFADVDLNTIKDRIAATIERGKETDPKELRRRVAELQLQLRHRDRDLAELRAASPTVPRETVDPEILKRLDQALIALDGPQRLLRELQEVVGTTLEQLVKQAAGPTQQVDAAAAELRAMISSSHPGPEETRADAPAEPQASAPPRNHGRTVAADRVQSRNVAEAGPVHDDDALSPARQRLLQALAAMESIGLGDAAKLQLALWAGVSPKSSGYSNNLGALRTAGLVDYPGPGRVALTARGRGHVQGEDLALASLAEFHEHIQRLLPAARWRIMAALLRVHPTALAKAELAQQVNVSASSSGYSNNLGGLRSLGLIDYPQPGTVAATDLLFPAGLS